MAKTHKLTCAFLHIVKQAIIEAARDHQITPLPEHGFKIVVAYDHGHHGATMPGMTELSTIFTCFQGLFSLPLFLLLPQ